MFADLPTVEETSCATETPSAPSVTEHQPKKKNKKKKNHIEGWSLKHSSCNICSNTMGLETNRFIHFDTD
jgi:hypothetical protein